MAPQARIMFVTIENSRHTLHTQSIQLILTNE